MQHFLDFDDLNRTERIKRVRQALINFGFYHEVVQVCRMYAEYKNHGNYAYSGGVLDQPDSYWHDMSVMRNLEFYVKELLPFAHEEQPESWITTLKKEADIEW